MINSNLNRTISVSGELNTSRQLQCQSRISYNDLCFPKTSNYGSMKKKKCHQPTTNGNGYLGQSRLAQIQAANSELYSQNYLCQEAIIWASTANYISNTNCIMNRKNKVQLFVISDYKNKQDVEIFDAILLFYDMYYGMRST